MRTSGSDEPAALLSRGGEHTTTSSLRDRVCRLCCKSSASTTGLWLTFPERDEADPRFVDSEEEPPSLAITGELCVSSSLTEETEICSVSLGEPALLARASEFLPTPSLGEGKDFCCVSSRETESFGSTSFGLSPTVSLRGTTEVCCVSPTEPASLPRGELRTTKELSPSEPACCESSKEPTSLADSAELCSTSSPSEEDFSSAEIRRAASLGEEPASRARAEPCRSASSGREEADLWRGSSTTETTVSRPLLRGDGCSFFSSSSCGLCRPSASGRGTLLAESRCSGRDALPVAPSVALLSGAL